MRFKRCELHAFVVMPNHVHLLATQFVPLAEWLGPLKGFTANQAKKPSDSVTARFGRTKVTITWCEAKKSFAAFKVHRVESR